MLVYFDRGEQNHADTKVGRYIPYDVPVHDASGQYYDFRKSPELISEVLEDFLPYQQYPATERFYRLLLWANGPDSIFESTDCLLRSPSNNETPHLGGGADMQIIGRIMIIFRDKARSTREAEMGKFGLEVENALHKQDVNWNMGAVGYAFYPAHFVELGDEPSDKTTGKELSLRFWAWGDSENDCFSNLDRLFLNLHEALIESSKLLTPNEGEAGK